MSNTSEGVFHLQKFTSLAFNLISTLFIPVLRDLKGVFLTAAVLVQTNKGPGSEMGFTQLILLHHSQLNPADRLWSCLVLFLHVVHSVF